MLERARRHRSRPGCADSRTRCVPQRRPRIRSRRCASWSSPTSSPTPPPRSAGAGSATRSRRCARRGVEVEVFSFPPGTRRLPAGDAAPAAAAAASERFDLVHAHYGLAGWCARLAGARPLVVTFHGTDVRHPVVGPMSRRLAWRVDLVAAVSRALFAAEDGRPGLPPRARLARSSPAGRTSSRFGPMPRERGAARARPRPRRPLPPLPRQPGPAREARRPRRRAGRGLRRRAAHRRRDRARADAALDQRRRTPSSSPPTTRASG